MMTSLIMGFAFMIVSTATFIVASKDDDFDIAPLTIGAILGLAFTLGMVVFIETLLEIGEKLGL